ncbi:MAG: NYN domain-containing protein [Candidatus Peribacteraceae bacterium]|nr:NYN domain-containing protein [Candidatus Peribacteraceae bacterium]
MKIGIMIDANNLFYTLMKKRNGKLNYAKYLEFCKELGYVNYANVYGVHVRGQAIDFLTKLKTIGYLPCYMNVNERDKTKIKATVRIVVEAIAHMLDYDTLILGSSDKNLIPLLEYLKSQNKKVIILATNIPKTMHTAAHKCIEIPASMLEKK